MAIGWQFPHNGGGTSQGFSDGAIDTFAGKRLSSLVREVIQNSLDAVDRSQTDPVTVQFSLAHIPKEKLGDLDDLRLHLSKCSEMAAIQKLQTACEFHDRAVKTISSKADVPVLVISDSNTNGLSGPIDEEHGPWFALTKGTGITQKQGEGSLGSFGHGSKAPFAMGALRTVYYLTRTVNTSGNEEIRFQGKSILQSHKHPETNETTQGTGFYGHKTNLAPLINDEVPEWALSEREKHAKGLGTTLLIPHTRFRYDLFPETKITVVANFFYAILQNNLRVIVDGEMINQSNVKDVFEWCKEKIATEQDEIDHEHVLECFKSIETIIKPDHHNHQEISGFGRIDWFLRFGDEINYRAVAISRQSGMLITRKPPKLERFPNKKNFDMFVFVNAGDGSDALKRLENPAHDNFEFDRVQDAEDAKKILDRYDQLQKKIREVLESYASIEASDEVQLSELSQLMFDLGESEEKSKNTERGATMFISTGAVTHSRSSLTGKSASSGVKDGKGQRHGETKGSGGGGGSTGNSEGTGEKDIQVLGGSDGVTSGSARVQVKGLRIAPVKTKEGIVRISFSTMVTGRFNFQLLKSGETEQEKDIVPLKYDGKLTSGYQMNIDSPGRHTITLEVENRDDLNFALEGWVDAV